MITGVVIAVLIIFSAFFSATETAFTSANRIRLKGMSENGSKGAEKALAIMEKYDKALTTILVGNNIVNIATSSLATILAISLFGDVNGPLISTIAVTIIVLIFGEIMPKTLAKSHAESFAIHIASILSFLMFILTPISAFFLLLQRGANKFFSKKNKEVTVTEQELMHIIDEIEDEGVLEAQESKLVRNALEFDELLVEEILTPRVKVVAVDVNEDIDNLRKLFFNEGYTRIPVYEKTIDHIIGVINYKDFLHNMFLQKDFQIRDLLLETLYVPSLMCISEVLKKMQREKLHLAVVIDQYGGTLGIVTLEDILEELVGEIWDESDEIVYNIKFIDENSFELHGDLLIVDFNRYFENNGMDFEINSDCNTVGGWVVELFGKLPEVDDSVKTEHFTIKVCSLNERRIDKLCFTILKPDGDKT